jgi:hypothetical protein
MAFEWATMAICQDGQLLFVELGGHIAQLRVPVSALLVHAKAGSC